MANIYYDQDANLELVTDKVVAIIGYGNQGRAQALNMRDSGVKKIIIGSREDGSYEQAIEDGFEVFPIADASSCFFQMNLRRRFLRNLSFLD